MLPWEVEKTCQSYALPVLHQQKTAVEVQTKKFSAADRTDLNIGPYRKRTCLEVEPYHLS